MVFQPAEPACGNEKITEHVLNKPSLIPSRKGIFANNPRVSLPLMVRDMLAEVEQERHNAAEDLREMNDRKERLEALRGQLTGFDAAAYDSAVTLLGGLGRSVAELSATLARCAEAVNQAALVLDSAGATRDAALADVAAARPVRDYWREIDRLTAERDTVERDATRARASLTDERVRALEHAARRAGPAVRRAECRPCGAGTHRALRPAWLAGAPRRGQGTARRHSR